MAPILIEGYTSDELLEMPDESLAPYLFTDDPLVFSVGTAEILGKFRLGANRLIIELAQIEGGGEGVLPTLWLLANRYAARQHLDEVEWIVHAVHCAKPNLKLRHLLERRGFVVEDVKGIGTAYHFVNKV
jgi:hypothetical protein